jgi:NAD(P)-dependent dehydrogenase (short-subunit alcohol dehydrogenase family)
MSERRVAVITGAGGGIGAATCRLFVERGMRVVAADVSARTAQEVAEELDPTGESVTPINVDVSSAQSVEAMIAEATTRFGSVDVLVNLAGITSPGPSEAVSDEDWSRLVDIHLGGTFRCSRAAFPALSVSRSAAIVNTASVAAWLGLPGRASYCAAKAGIEGLTRTLAVEWAKHGIRVNAIAPGYIGTRPVEAMIQRGFVDESRLRARIPLDRLGRPEEVASAIHFLASPDASYITGHTLTVDAGLTVSGQF